MDQAQQTTSQNLYVEIRSPDKLMFAGEATAVSGVNEKGPFDILGYHENFISIIRDKIVLHFKGRLKQEFAIDIAILKVSGNRVSIFVGIERL